MKKLLLFALILILNSCSRGTDNPTPTPTPEPTLILKTENLSFQDAPTIPQQMWLSTSSSYSGKFIVSTGQKTYIFNPNSNSWTYHFQSDIPSNYGWGNVHFNNALVKFFNGWDYSAGSTNSNYYAFGYDYNGSVSSYNNFIPLRSSGFTYNSGIGYIAGGSKSDGTFSNKLLRYNDNFSLPTQFTLEEITQLPEAKETQCEIIGNKIYVIGGYNGTTSKRIDVYDITTNKWTFLGNMPYGFSSHATCVQGTKIWIVGNYNLTDQQLAYYNTATNEFATINSNIIPRRHANAEVLNNKLYIFSGATDSSSASALTSMQVANLP